MRNEIEAEMERGMPKQISLRPILSSAKQCQHNRWTYVSQDTMLLPILCSSKDNGSFTANLIGCKIKVWWPMDKAFYEGVVESFDTQKMKHVILHENGDVEVPLIG